LTDWPEVGVIVHPFGNPELDRWFRHLGSRIVHAHVQLADGNGQRCRLRTQPGPALDALAVLRDHRFQGTFTLEFTEGVGSPPEDQEALFRAAVDDLAFLKEHWG
jgi:sugar phosphate isomerase/epimerase